MDMPLKRTRIAFDTSPAEYKALSAAAEAAGIPVNTLSRALFRWAFPLFAAEGFNLAELKQRFGKGEALAGSIEPHLEPMAQRATMKFD